MSESEQNQYLEGYQLLVRLENGLNTIAKRHGVSFSQYLILKQIIENNCNEPSMLARAFVVSPPAMSRKLTALFREGKIVKLYNLKDEDQRITNLKVTEKGEAIVNTLNEEYAAILLPYSEKSEALMAQFIIIANQILKK
ncbi:hypothetical protein KNP65_04885 [Latilactobacillus curvatus]|uniref:hypothetical protein n=1 Tax=Latilactobacillus curvatus TaxID=28038 RepID=UPI002410CC83|nr:hypothetical protein [Latilactobacillus curvatus]MDG2979271.1 hypothetical protein [Latilactobacillus curvatus]